VVVEEGLKFKEEEYASPPLGLLPLLARALF